MHLSYSESAPRFFNNLWGLRRGNIQRWETGYYIMAPREQNAVKFFRLSHRKISLCVFSICAKGVKSGPNSVNIGTTWKNLKSFLSILDRMQWAENPSHATVPFLSNYGAGRLYIPICGRHLSNLSRLVEKAGDRNQVWRVHRQHLPIERQPLILRLLLFVINYAGKRIGNVKSKLILSGQTFLDEFFYTMDWNVHIWTFPSFPIGIQFVPLPVLFISLWVWVWVPSLSLNS